ncbi:MAG: hypothetical protein CEE40_10560 [Chloroflexi bacterium B3_Chlor]|nr:MAG: hypothetical protein CEE40_10560 [Chloroflexi bacterium B3_Chlor]
MEDLIGAYYEVSSAQRQNAYERGEIYWAPSLYLERDLTLVRPFGSDAWAGEIDGWEFVAAGQADLRPPPFEHPPLWSVRLETREEYLRLKAKQRPSILLSSAPEPWTYRSGETRESVYLMLPMFSFHDDDPAEFRLRVRALQYRELFYLPSDESLRMVEGFTRFDRAHVVPRNWLQGHRVRLSDDAMLVLDEWFKFFILGTADDWLLEYRADLGRAVDRLLARAG